MQMLRPVRDIRFGTVLRIDLAVYGLARSCPPRQLPGRRCVSGCSPQPAPADPLELFTGDALAGVLAVLPLTPGGIGIVESVLIPTLTGFGAPAQVALVGCSAGGS